jgi:Domain of unknown function (DUF4304)
MVVARWPPTLDRMNALKLRDEVFSELHLRCLKPAGYKKKGHWSIRDLGGLYQSFYLRASRFGSSDEAVFWIDVQVFSQHWHTLLFAPTPFKGPAEGTPSLLTESLEEMAAPSSRASIKLASNADIEPMIDWLCEAASAKALPLLRSCESYEGLLSYWQCKPEASDRHLVSAGLFRLLNQDDEARKAIARAKELAPHQNNLKWLELRERTLWQHAA